MIFPIGLENNIEARSLAWVLGHPVCFSVGENATIPGISAICSRSLARARKNQVETV